MADVTSTSRSIGTATRDRQLAACGVLLVGAVACTVATVADVPLFRILALLGATGVIAWLVDGSSARYMGPGLAALAVGGGITAYRALEVTPIVKAEHTIVYPLLGVALLVASYFHPMAIRGAGAFLVTVGFIAWFDSPWEAGWSLTGILILWSAANLVRINREDKSTGSASRPRTVGRDTGRDDQVDDQVLVKQ